jgi:hypothetical protein
MGEPDFPQFQRGTGCRFGMVGRVANTATVTPMTPSELMLLADLPRLRGVESAAVWPERPYGLVLTVDGAGSVYCRQLQ